MTKVLYNIYKYICSTSYFVLYLTLCSGNIYKYIYPIANGIVHTNIWSDTHKMNKKELLSAQNDYYNDIDNDI